MNDRDKYVTLDLELVFRSSKVVETMATLWSEFYSRIDDPDIDRAIWICNRFPAWVGVKPGRPTEDPEDEPAFVISTLIGEIDPIHDELRARRLPEKDYQRLMGPIYHEYYTWLRNGTKRSWEQSQTRSAHAKKGPHEFGVYTTEIDDLAA
ncbi:hypothetical protein Pan216_03500 [Planctomycetes bacterium Pan216]|uniref:Uncharacterized protein n=1 Tax=Kolteria novifilia TaxID=2527975 RepID=A0A518AXS6_9BACT|nr:hypothetical protein Pan216_03500 [Planctomycetes bacterium Pan216]